MFILGPGRTGSKLIMNILNKHPDIYITPEIRFLEFWKPSVFDKIKIYKDKNNKYSSQVIDELFFQKTTPFHKFHEITKNLDKDIIFKKFLKSDKYTKDILTIFLRENSLINNKNIWGAKFPVHYSYLPTLIKWFPNAKFIFLTRDPIAILKSELRMKSRKKRSGNFPKLKNQYFYELSVLFYVVIQWNWSLYIFQKYKEKNIILLKFENLIMDPPKTIDIICKFLNINFANEMLDVKEYDSSFGGKNIGFNKKSINQADSNLNKHLKNICIYLCNKHLKLLGYKKIMDRR